MAKKSRKSKISSENKEARKPQSSALSERNQDLIFIALICGLLLFLLKPLVIDGLSPQGVDVLASISTNHQVKEWEQESGDKALWNPYIFAGMPRYQRINPVTFSLDSILNWLGRFFNNVFIYYLFAGIGTYLLFRYLKLPPFIAFTGAVIFILMPHYKSLYLEGHYTKFRALMLLPCIFLSFLHFLDRRSLLSAALFALAFGIQIRTQHYQIVFYTGLLVFATGVYPIFRDLAEKQYKKFGQAAILVIAAVSLAILTASQPLFLAKEYLPWSKRGKTTINIDNPAATQDVDKTDGVSMEYATQWSTAPSEILTWIIPRIYGGMSGEKYTGDAVSQLKGRIIPGYWGVMPFTQSYEYMGALTLLLAAIGFYYNRKNKLILSLGLFSIFLILLSFGRHASWFYALFYDYVPFFNKFRAPMMSVTVNFFIFALMAGFGLKSLFELGKETFDIKKLKPLFIILGGFLGLGVIVWLLGQGFSFSKAGEAYDEQTMNILMTIRKELFDGDMLRYLALISLGIISILVYLKNKIPFSALVFLLAAISIIDLVNIRGKVNKDYINVEKLEHRHFRETETDKFLLQDKSVYRVLPVGSSFGDNRWAYHHQTIGGYSPIKMFAIEEIVQNNLRNGAFPNPNIIKILNVKYLISPQQLNRNDLQLVKFDDTQKLYTYLIKNYSKRGYFVPAVNLITDEFERVKELNNPSFKPDSVAIIETEISDFIEAPDSSSVEVTFVNPNERQFKVFTDKQALFVISELYFPPGWKTYLDGNQLATEKIYKTNHAIQSIIVPPGKHIVDLKFEPDSYADNVLYASGSLVLLYLVIASSLVKMFLKKKQDQQEVVKE